MITGLSQKREYGVRQESPSLSLSFLICEVSNLINLLVSFWFFFFLLVSFTETVFAECLNQSLAQTT